MSVLKKINAFGDEIELFDAIHPIGETYTQYPGQKSPNELWGQYSTWEVLDYGGAFFRSSGGKSDTFEKSIPVSSISGTTVTFAANHGLSVGSIIYDSINNEGRVVTSVTNATTVVVDTAFSHSNMTSLIVGQPSQNRYHLHSMTHSHTITDTGHVHGISLYWGDSAGGGHNSSVTGSAERIYQKNGSTSASTSNISINNYTGNSGYSGDSTNQEARSENFTYRVWVRRT